MKGLTSVFFVLGFVFSLMMVTACESDEGNMINGDTVEVHEVSTHPEISIERSDGDVSRPDGDTIGCESAGPWGCDPNYAYCDTDEDCSLFNEGCICEGDSFVCRVGACEDHSCYVKTITDECDYGCGVRGCQEPECMTVVDCPNRGGGCECVDGNVVCTGTACVNNECDTVTEIRECEYGCDDDACIPQVIGDECTVDADCDDQISCTSSFVVTGSKVGDQCINGFCISEPVPNYGLCGPDGSLHYCFEGECKHFEECNDHNDCTYDMVSGSTGECAHVLLEGCEPPSCSNHFDCADGNACTDDYCQNGQCVNTTIQSAVGLPCGESSVCLDDGTCEPVDCIYDIECDDGIFCTLDSCENHQCVYLESLDCIEPPTECTSNDDCVDVDYGSYCTYSPVADKSFCQECYEGGVQGGCADGQNCYWGVLGASDGENYSFYWCSVCSFDPECDDGDPCTQDECDRSGFQMTDGHCVNTPIPGCGEPECTINSECMDGDACRPGVCMNGTCTYNEINCDDDNVCTNDFCHNGTCNNVDLMYCVECEQSSDCNYWGFCLGHGNVIEAAGTCTNNRCDMKEVECPEGTTCELTQFGTNMWHSFCEQEPECTTDADCGSSQICQGETCVDLPSADILSCTITCVDEVNYPEVVVWYGPYYNGLYEESGHTFMMPLEQTCSWAFSIPVFEYNCTDSNSLWGEGETATVECNYEVRNLPHPTEGDQGKRRVFIDSVSCNDL